jgi:predicted nucleic acid-binding protein
LSEERPRPLVLDTSVAVKFYVPEEGHEVALLDAAESGVVTLSAPGTLLPEGYNAVWQSHRRSAMSLGEVREAWDRLTRIPVALYPPEDLIVRAGEITAETGAIVYDALFLALADDLGAVMITDDRKLLKTLGDTVFARLTLPLADVDSVI